MKYCYKGITFVKFLNQKIGWSFNFLPQIKINRTANSKEIILSWLFWSVEIRWEKVQDGYFNGNNY